MADNLRPPGFPTQVGTARVEEGSAGEEGSVEEGTDEGSTRVEGSARNGESAGVLGVVEARL